MRLHDLDRVNIKNINTLEGKTFHIFRKRPPENSTLLVFGNYLRNHLSHDKIILELKCCKLNFQPKRLYQLLL